MPRKNEFDIYESDAGYVAVTNEVRRKILEALAKRDLELPGLVEVTGRAKPTLSNLHVRELLDQGLIEEMPHPTDGRRKVYRLRGRRIGSSDVPIDQLRGAVRQYVSRSPLAFTLSLSSVVAVLVAAAGAAPARALHEQGVALGGKSAHIFPGGSPRDLLTAVGQFWEREGVARPTKLDFDRLTLEVDLPHEFGGVGVDRSALGEVLAGFLQGVVAARAGGDLSVRLASVGAGRLEFTLAP